MKKSWKDRTVLESSLASVVSRHAGKLTTTVYAYEVDDYELWGANDSKAKSRYRMGGRRNSTRTAALLRYW